jgi:thiol-disulfide isomerase/thioredoxin
LAILAVIGALVAAELLSGTSNSSSGRLAPALPRGVVVPPRVSLSSLRGKPAAINFWASWCTPCRQEAPVLSQLSHTLHGQARLVGVDWSDGLASARSFVSRYSWSYPNLSDPDGVVGNRFGINGLPTTYIIDSRGAITQVLRGPQQLGTLRAALHSAG